MEQFSAAPMPVISQEDLCEPAVVHQASGMLSVRLGVSCSAALTHMRSYATSTEQALRAVAEKVVRDRSVDLRD